MTHYPRKFAVALLALAACRGDSGTGTTPGKAQLRIVSGAGVTDTIQAQLGQLVIAVEVGGTPAAGVSVTLATIASSDVTRNLENPILVSAAKGGATSTTMTAVTGADGRITVWPVLGTIAGEARLAIAATSLSLSDTARFTVMPGVATSMKLGVRDTALSPGAQYSIAAAIADRFNNRVTPEYSVVRGSGTVDANGLVKEGTSAGRMVVLVRGGTRTDTAYSTVVFDDRLLLYSGYELFRARLDLSQRTVINSTHGGNAVLSPDGRTLALILNDFDTYRGSSYTIFVADVQSPTTIGTKLFPRSTIAQTRGHVFSDDGKWIYFSGAPEDKPYSIWRVHPDGTGLEQLATSPDHLYFVAVSPDGGTIAWVESSRYRITVLNLATRVKTMIAPTLFASARPAFSPDSKRLAFVAGSIHIANVDGTGTVAHYPCPFGCDKYVSWSKDGQWLISSENSLATFTYLINASSGEFVPVPGLRFITDGASRRDDSIAR